MKKYAIVTGIVLFLGMTACKKEAGSGGTSSIQGTVMGRVYTGSNGNAAESEITQITLPNGSDINDGDYLLLNTPNGGTHYYVWFKWDNGNAPDPGLSGRTGIQVTFNFSQSNATIATNTASAIQTVAGTDYNVTLSNDIVTVTNTATGEVPDADELSSDILVDIANQGKGSTSGSTSYTEGPIVNERVYLVYGDEGFYSEDVRTDANGNYQFKGLNRGNYRVFTYTEDTLNTNGPLKEVSTNVVIDTKKDIVKAQELFVIQL